VYYTAYTDRAPDSDFSRDASGNLITYKIGDTCVPPPPPPSAGALALSPKTETDSLGQQACVTATATVSPSDATPVPNIVVRFSVTGASGNLSGPNITDVNGQARFCYTNQTTPGPDAITAFADNDGNGTQGSGEPSDTGLRELRGTSRDSGAHRPRSTAQSAAPGSGGHLGGANTNRARVRGPPSASSGARGWSKRSLLGSTPPPGVRGL
jgi:hypothetical protein